MDEEQGISIKDMKCPSDAILLDQPWGQKLLKSSVELAQKTTLIWIKLAATIGGLDVEDYSERFLYNVDKLYSEIILDMETLKEKKLNAIMQLINKLESTCDDLQIPLPESLTHFNYDDDTFVLSDVYDKLQADFAKYEREAEDRRTQLRKLNRKQAELARALGRNLEPLSEKPLPKEDRLCELEVALEKLENERIDRDSEFVTKRDEFVQIVGELGAEEILLEYESELLYLEEGKVLTTDEDMRLLAQAHRRLTDKRTEIAEEIDRFWTKISDLWSKLQTDPSEQSQFRRNNIGVTLGILGTLENEHDRLQQIKRENLGDFVEKLRAELRVLWGKCHRVERDEIENFRFFHTDVYSEDLLNLHELEIEQCRLYYEDHKNFLKTVNEFVSVWNEKEALALAPQVTGVDRYKNRGGKLLEEEKSRARINRIIPKLRQKLLNMAETYAAENGRDFRTFGKTIPEFLDELQENYQKRLEEVKSQLSAQKSQRERSVTPARSRLNLFENLADLRTPKVISKRKQLTPSTDLVDRKKFKSSGQKIKANNTGNPKINTASLKRLSREKLRRRSLRRKLPIKKDRSSDEKKLIADENSYMDFKVEITRLKDCRSTTYECSEPSQLTVL